MARIRRVDAAYARLQERTSPETAQRLAHLAGAVARAAGQAAAVAGVVAVQAAGTLVAAVRAGAETARQARETLATVQRIAGRAESLMDEVEEPLRALAPGLRRLARILDDPAVEDLPRTVRRVQDDVLPVLRTLADTHDKVAFIAGSTDRIIAFVDDTSRLMTGLPGAGLLGRRRPPGRVVTAEQVAPTDRAVQAERVEPPDR